MDTTARSKWRGWRGCVPFRAGRTILRELQASDATFLQSLFLDPEVHRFAPGLPDTAQAVEQYVAWSQRKADEQRYVCLAVALDAQVIGVIHAWPLEPTAKTAEWGFILRQSHWGRGLFQDAAGAFITLAVHQLGVERLEARTAVNNARGAAALTRLGAHREGVLRQAFGLNDQRVDCFMWSILAAEWSADPNHEYQYAMPGVGDVPEQGTLPGRDHVCHEPSS